MLNANRFLFLFAGFVILLVMYFQSAKKKKYPARLNMKKEVPPEEAFASSPQKTASLNVMFNYNGHSFDAYETLGVPAGSDFSDVRTAYQKAIEGCDESSQDFFKTALDAIKNQK